jgi:CheY-specific phosphatase CheX
MPRIDADIEDITRAIWASLFELPLRVEGESRLGSDSLVTACVQVVGAWTGAVILQSPMSLARALAEQMFQSDRPLTLDEVRDALGELANMIAGNVKALFPGPSRISLPAVAAGSDYRFDVVDGSALTTVSFSYNGQPLRVTLFQGSAENGAAIT